MPKNSTLSKKVGAYRADKNERTKETRNLTTTLTKKSVPRPRTQDAHSHLTINDLFMRGEDLKNILKNINKIHNIQ